MVSPVVLKKTAAVNQALRLCGQRVRVEYWGLQQLGSLFQWPLLSMCSSSKSSTHGSKSGTQSPSLSRPNAHPSRQFPHHYVDHMPSCLHVLLPSRPAAKPADRGYRRPIWQFAHTHPNKQFPDHFVPFCLHVLFRVRGLLCSPGGAGGGNATLANFGGGLSRAAGY